MVARAHRGVGRLLHTRSFACSTAAAALFVIALFAVPTQACGQSVAALGPDRGYPHCPEYDLLPGGGVGFFGANAYGQFVVSAGEMYFVWDEPSLWAPGQYLFAWWFYAESNNIAGLQRADEFCDNTPEGAYSDAQLC